MSARRRTSPRGCKRWPHRARSSLPRAPAGKSARLFEIEDLGPQHLAGFAELQRAWRVVGESGVVSRFEALRSVATPLVGREEELELLVRRWQQAKTGEGRVVLVSGEPGIGKSRLTAALSQRIASEPHTRLRYFCSPYHQDSALYPFIVQLERAAGFARDDTVEQKLGKLRELLCPVRAARTKSSCWPSCCHCRVHASQSQSQPAAQTREVVRSAAASARSRGAKPACLDGLRGRALDRPDLARIARPDPRSGSTAARALVVTFRPEFQHSWGGQPHVTMLALNRLGGREGAALVEQLAGNTGLARRPSTRSSSAPTACRCLLKS